MLIPDFGSGGAERVFSQVSKALARQHRVIECVFNRPIDARYISGNEVVALGVPAGKNVLAKALYFLLRVYRLRKIKRAYRVDLCISHLEGADYVNVLSRIHEETILCVHGTKLHDGNIQGVLGWLRLNLMLPFLYRRSSHVVCVSKAIRNELMNRVKLPAGKLSVIYNFFDLDEVRRLSEEPLPGGYDRLMANYDVIVTSGRLVPEKNHRLLIRLMPKLLEASPNAKLLILGEGALMRQLAGEAASLGLRVQHDEGPLLMHNDVFFPGFCNNPFPIVRSARVFVLPSLWEGFPLALCEALICGVPAIAHDCPTGPREILAPDLAVDMELTSILRTAYGVLIPFSRKGDAESLRHWCGEILNLLNDPSARRRSAASGPKRVAALGRESIMKEWTNLVDRYA